MNGFKVFLMISFVLIYLFRWRNIPSGVVLSLTDVSDNDEITNVSYSNMKDEQNFISINYKTSDNYEEKYYQLHKIKQKTLLKIENIENGNYIVKVTYGLNVKEFNVQVDCKYINALNKKLCSLGLEDFIIKKTIRLAK